MSQCESQKMFISILFLLKGLIIWALFSDDNLWMNIDVYRYVELHLGRNESSQNENTNWTDLKQKESNIHINRVSLRMEKSCVAYCIEVLFSK